MLTYQMNEQDLVHPMKLQLEIDSNLYRMGFKKCVGWEVVYVVYEWC